MLSLKKAFEEKRFAEVAFPSVEKEVKSLEKEALVLVALSKIAFIM